MGRNGMFMSIMSESYHSYQGASTGNYLKQCPFGMSATLKDAMAPCNQKYAGNHDKRHQQQVTHKHSASHHPHADTGLSREGRHGQPVPCAASCPWRQAQLVSTKPKSEQGAHASVTGRILKVWRAKQQRYVFDLTPVKRADLGEACKLARPYEICQQHGNESWTVVNNCTIMSNRPRQAQ